MIAEYADKVKFWISEKRSDLFVAAVIFLVGMGGFGLGRLSVLWQNKAPVEVAGSDIARPFGSTTPAEQAILPQQKAISTTGRFVGSRGGSAYHYPWCPGALKIKEENKIWFQTKQEAVAKGYKPAGNCPGM